MLANTYTAVYAPLRLGLVCALNSSLFCYLNDLQAVDAMAERRRSQYDFTEL
jgi:hypothetical protein